MSFVQPNSIIYWTSQPSGDPTGFDPYTKAPIFSPPTLNTIKAWLERVSSIETTYQDPRRDPLNLILHGRLLCPKFMPKALTVQTQVEIDFNATATQTYRISEAYLYPEATTGLKRPYKRFGDAIRVHARLEANPEVSNWLCT